MLRNKNCWKIFAFIVDARSRVTFCTEKSLRLVRQKLIEMASDLTPEKFIGTQFRVELKDERVLDGVLTVVDPFGNLLMSNVYEDSKDNRRELGLVSIPRESIEKIVMDVKAFKKLQN